MSASHPYDVLIDRLSRRTAHIAILGLGYVGLPLAVAFAEAGFTVTGLDIDADKLTALRAGRSYIEDVQEARLRPLVGRRLFASASFDEVLAAAHVQGAQDLVRNGCLRLWPHRHGTDGFFAAVWQRS